MHHDRGLNALEIENYGEVDYIIYRMEPIQAEAASIFHVIVIYKRM